MSWYMARLNPVAAQGQQRMRQIQEESRLNLEADELKYGSPEERRARRAAELQKILAEAAYYEGGGAAGAKSRAEQEAFRKMFPQQGEKPVGVGGFKPKGPTHEQTKKKIKPKPQDITMPSGEVIKASEQAEPPFDLAEGFGYMRERGFGNVTGDIFDVLAEWLERQQPVRPPEFGFPQSESDIMFGQGPRSATPPVTRPKRKAERSGLGPWNLR